MSRGIRGSLGAAAAGVAIQESQLEALGRYAESLDSWNQRIRLTGAGSIEAILAEHVADALPLLAHLPHGPFRMLDVGSGGGFPAIVLALLRPDAQITMVEPIGKKHAFLRAMVRELPLPNSEAVQARIDRLSTEDDFDVAISRATWPIAEWLSRARPGLLPGRRILGQTGADLSTLPPDAVTHAYEHRGAQRHVVVLTGPPS
ncbi:MAG: 16S rRNA (guanine(527)-N(7))-methyltransferase RsmG [Deltaproteobacteria bacterium]|nr:16S rRNA (guanine(527)-N(7))-methyltransferase RsmG [Deltaproteobacteria bacterium]MBW2394524.1 16S rRNA (guanine(527)-N(7))-methyltransferase RsmG [Deltaproteobacteria bacterium]